ncbi:hypothetical protein LC605_25055 [Nostoc sp. CHAB 5836]|uniref:hypothetical protein n=1 Tax=Nostoc sp. CHAB 5836 TaxID=2780404 RepID=UPI001E449A32|nr:hypothetical protein [Nostoc sp. CHAB 5836]MCC5618294.1 hypothetical protein [Nostoc sp. CHAB 5836]
MWSQFIARCNFLGTTATATLTQFIELYLDDSVDKLDTTGGLNLDKRLDWSIKASVEEYKAYNNSNAHQTNETILAICSRLDKLESQLKSESNSNQSTTIHNIADLSQKVEGITARMTQLAEAIIKIQNYLNNQQGRGNKSYNNSSYRGQSPRMQPLTEEGLSTRLGVSIETVRKERIKLPAPLFVAWCKGKDRAGLGWEFHENTGLYHPVN